MFFKTPFFERKPPFSLLLKIKTINNLVDKLENFWNMVSTTLFQIL
jgi:hypothetical protein